MLQDNKMAYFDLTSDKSSYIEYLLVEKRKELLMKLELSVSNRFNHRMAEDFLNLKIQQLDNLINYITRKEEQS